MCIGYSEFDEYVYVMVTAPDGRVLTQRIRFKDTEVTTPWEASVGRVSTDYKDNYDTANLAVWTKFEIKCDGELNKLESIASHYIPINKRIIDIYILKLSSGATLKCTRNMEIKFLPLEELINEVKMSKHRFSLITVDVITFLGEKLMWTV